MSVILAGVAVHPLGEFYARRVMDPMVDLAGIVARDEAAHPHLYREVPPPARAALDGMRTLVGHDPQWPDAPMRSALTGDIYRDLAPELTALRSSAHHPIGLPTAVAALKQRYATLAEVIRAVNARTAPVFLRALDILTRPEVASRFGAAPVVGDYPALRPGLAALHDAILITLRMSGREKFELLQRVALTGAAVLSGALAGEPQASMGALAGAPEESVARDAYQWDAVLTELAGGVDRARAATDPHYLGSLTPVERDALAG